MAIVLSGVGYSVNPSPLAISEGGTGQSTATAAINALVPAQTGNSGKVLTTDGSVVSWQTGGGGGGGGSVTSVAVSVPAFLSVSGSPITSAGTIAISLSGTALPIANGGTGQTTASGAINALVPTQASNSGKVLSTDGSVVSWISAATGTVTSVAASGGTTGMSFTGGPISTTGTLTLAGTLAISNGGTGQTTAATAINALVPTQTGNSGKFLFTDGSVVSWNSAVQLNVTNTYTKAQIVTPATVTSGSTITIDASLSNNFRLVIGTNATLANPTNLVNGQVFNIMIVQDGTGSRTLAYGTKFKFVGGATPVLSTAANAVDILGCYYDGVNDAIYANLNKAYA